jgi:hypothetical protein
MASTALDQGLRMISENRYALFGIMRFADYTNADEEA